MKVQKISIGFKSVDYSRVNALQKLYLPSKEILLKLTKDVDVVLSSTKRNFPFHKSSLPVDAIKITARPLKLSFWERLLGLRKVKNYFPTGNLSNIIEFDGGTLEDVIAKTVAKVK